MRPILLSQSEADEAARGLGSNLHRQENSDSKPRGKRHAPSPPRPARLQAGDGEHGGGWSSSFTSLSPAPSPSLSLRILCVAEGVST
eukprot:scaffold157840_cov26-Tisochrysis_lutea.AAC.1